MKDTEERESRCAREERRESRLDDGRERKTEEQGKDPSTGQTVKLCAQEAGGVSSHSDPWAQN